MVMDEEIGALSNVEFEKNDAAFSRRFTTKINWGKKKKTHIPLFT